MLTTRLTELLGIDHPIISAPMARMSGGRLAAAVSAAGGLGTFGAALVAVRIDAAYVREQVASIRERTDRPFGIGFCTHNLPASEETFEAALELEPDAALFSFGDPSPWLPRARASGAVTICQVQTLEEAEVAAAAGAQVLVAQGNASGGHTGPANLLPFLVQVIDAFPELPVLAAGGIANGRSLAAVVAAGADGAWLGTVFTAVAEADEMSEDHKRLVVASDGSDTVLSNVFDVMNATAFGDLAWPAHIRFRTRRNAFVDRWHGREDELRGEAGDLAAAYRRSSKQRDLEVQPVIYGEGAASITAIRSAAEVITELCADAERHLQAAAGRCSDRTGG